MISQDELDRALMQWKARKLGQEVELGEDLPGLQEEPTRVADPHYQSRVETPQAESIDDYDPER